MSSAGSDAGEAPAAAAAAAAAAQVLCDILRLCGRGDAPLVPAEPADEPAAMLGPALLLAVAPDEDTEAARTSAALLDDDGEGRDCRCGGA